MPHLVYAFYVRKNPQQFYWVKKTEKDSVQFSGLIQSLFVQVTAEI